MEHNVMEHNVMERTNMEQRDLIHRYLHDLNRYLARLSQADAQEVLREIESHLFDVIEQGEASGQVIDAATVLKGFGEPRELAAQYVAHVTTGAPPPKGFKAIQKVKQGVTISLYYAMALFGFSIAAALIMIAIAKIAAPELVGVWSAAGGNSFIIGYTAPSLPQEREMLGMWLAPIAGLTACAIFEITRRVLGVLKSAM